MYTSTSNSDTVSNQTHVSCPTSYVNPFEGLLSPLAFIGIILLFLCNMLIALALTAQKFDATELTAAGIWSVLSAIELVFYSYYFCRHQCLSERYEKQNSKIQTHNSFKDVSEMNDDELKGAVNLLSALVNKRLQQKV